MNSKYAHLPDIDTAQDVYETEDVFPSSHGNKGDSSDDDLIPTRSGIRAKQGTADVVNREELDNTNLMSAEDASKVFRKAERKRRKVKTQYIYPPSSDEESADDDSPDASTKAKRPVPIVQRLRTLQAELASLEADCSDPSNPLLKQAEDEDGLDPGELIMGLVDVRGRLEKLRKVREGRGKLVGVIANAVSTDKEDYSSNHEEEKVDKDGKPPPVRSIVEMDKRVGQLEKLMGSSSTTLDETSPLPPPLLPLVTRLNLQITLLTQPRHIDSISRRLKLLLSDLERTNQPARSGKQSSNPAPTVDHAQNLLPFLTRLTPLLPHIPHVLTRLKTLSALHTSASEFAQTLAGLEEEQRKTREGLKLLESTVERLETSAKGNSSIVSSNIKDLDARVEGLLGKLDKIEPTTKYN